jgi:hypothetical protein
LGERYQSLWEAVAEELGEVAFTKVGVRAKEPTKDDLRNASAISIILVHLATGQTLEEATDSYLRIAGNLGNRRSICKLPDKTWKNLEDRTARTRDEWKDLPRRLDWLLNNGFDCPSCGAHFDPRRLINPDEGTYLGKEKPSKFHFQCPGCNRHIVWNIATGSALLPKAA